MFTETTFSPHRFDFTCGLDPSTLSLMPRTLFIVANDDVSPGGELPLPNIYRRRFCDDPDVIRMFQRLDRAEQVELLTFYTMPLHETRHHLDFATTPFAARFYVQLAAEYLAFQASSPFLLQNQELMSPGPVRQLARRLAAAQTKVPAEWRAQWDAFESIVLNLQATTDTRGLGRSDDVVVDEGNPIEVCRTRFSFVTINQKSRSFEPSFKPGWYLRAPALLEGRAVMESLLWIIHTLGNSDSVPEILAAYLAENHPPEARYDYRFVLDLAAAWLGHPTFEDALRIRQTVEIRSVLHLIDNAAWFALNAGAHAVAGKLAPENIFQRFLYALSVFDIAGRRGSTMPPYALLAANEDTDDARRWGIVPTETALERSRTALAMTRRTLSYVWQQGIADHFAYVFDVLDKVLDLRRGSGIAMPSGAPASGNSLWNLDDDTARIAFGRYEPDRWVGEWFTFRNKSLFSPSTTTMTLTYLREQFGLAEVVHQCECGALLSVVVPRWRPEGAVSCPSCHRTFSFTKDELIVIQEPST